MHSFDQVVPVTHEHQKIRFYIKFQWAYPNDQAPCRALIMYESRMPGLGIAIGDLGGDWPTYDAAWNEVMLAMQAWVKAHPNDARNAAAIAFAYAANRAPSFRRHEKIS